MSRKIQIARVNIDILPYCRLLNMSVCAKTLKNLSERILLYLKNGTKLDVSTQKSFFYMHRLHSQPIQHYILGEYIVHRLPKVMEV